jgi:hypothetical protein
VTLDDSVPVSTLEILEMAGEAEELVGVPVDFVLRQALDQSPNRFAREHILATAVQLYGEPRPGGGRNGDLRSPARSRRETRTASPRAFRAGSAPGAKRNRPSPMPPASSPSAGATDLDRARRIEEVRAFARRAASRSGGPAAQGSGRMTNLWPNSTAADNPPRPLRPTPEPNSGRPATVRAFDTSTCQERTMSRGARPPDAEGDRR